MIDVSACFSHASEAIPLYLLQAAQWEAFLLNQSPQHQAWLRLHNFSAKARQWCLLPDEHGGLSGVCVGIDNVPDLYALSDLPLQLPLGDYRWVYDATPHDLNLLALGWGLGAYQYTRYKTATRAPARLSLPAGFDHSRLMHELEASYWVRDLINTPAVDMMPQHLAEAALDLTTRFGGQCHQIVGDDLLIHNYPMVHAVGRASSHAPRLIELRFGDHHLPQVTLIGKGVCFDSGGLDIKPANGMLLMKKDMGGAAHALGLAQLILAQGLAVQLRVLIPAVENAINGNAFRPGDILNSRHGLTVEIGNTDAEGRLILADALTAASEENPALVLDFATLTGAARVAVGTDIAAYFTPDEHLATALQQASDTTQDPCWRLPLFPAYKKMLASPIADLNNAPGSSYAGAITAALFLQAFVPEKLRWCHFDVMAFNVKNSPGKAEGGEAMAVRATYQLIEQLFGTVS